MIKYFKNPTKFAPHFFFLRWQSNLVVFGKFAKTRFFRKIVVAEILYQFKSITVTGEANCLESIVPPLALVTVTAVSLPEENLRTTSMYDVIM